MAVRCVTRTPASDSWPPSSRSHNAGSSRLSLGFSKIAEFRKPVAALRRRVSIDIPYTFNLIQKLSAMTPKQQRIQEILKKKTLSEDDFIELGEIRMREIGGLTFQPKCKFEPGAFRHLVGVRWLVTLSFKSSSIALDDIAYIGQYSRLKQLEFIDCPIGDPEVRKLGVINQLRYLDISGTKITDRSLKYVGAQGNLESLFLSRTRVTNRGLSQLVGLPALQCLQLQSTEVDNDGIMQLVGLSRLNMSNGLMRGSRVTRDGVSDFNLKQAELVRNARRKKKLASQPKPTECDAARAVLFSFLADLNKWWPKVGKWSDSFDAKVKRDKQEKLLAAADAALAEVFAKYCFNPTKALATQVGYSREIYYAIDRINVISVEEPARNKIVFTMEDDSDGFGGRFQFVMQKSKGDWRVHHKKVWDGGWKKWAF